MELTVGTIITGKVTTITKFGAFVALPGGKSGLVHISEVSGSFVTDVHDFLTEGQEVPVKVLSISPAGAAAQAPAPVCGPACAAPSAPAQSGAFQSVSACRSPGGADL